METEKLERLIREYDALVPPTYHANQFPRGFELRPADWALTPDVIDRKPVIATIDGEQRVIRPISELDLEFLSNHVIELAQKGMIDLQTNYQCGLNCAGCFSQEGIYSDVNNLMRWQDILDVVRDAQQIGLAGVKFLGPGELLQNPDLFDILDALEEIHMPISIFTKGVELGDDDAATMIFGNQGIRSAKDLVQRVYEYDCVRILLGFNSFDPERQDRMVGSYNATANYEVVDGVFTRRGVMHYTAKRNQALINLTRAGFNDPARGQHLSLIAAPVGLDQGAEVAAMYRWAAERNMPLVIAPTMESGPRALSLLRYNSKLDPGHELLIDLMVGVYSTAVENGILSMEQIRHEGISAYPGSSPCNQVANGLYLRLNGRIQICPGRSDEKVIFGNVHHTNIAKLWVKSANYGRGATSNNWCPAKENGMPQAIQEIVMERLEEKYGGETYSRN
ncbi:MAG: radical SAM protein [Nanoarchaeota archaeon]